MAILNVLTETTGLVGVVPRTIYIQTNNTSVEIESLGYLDGIVREGIALFQTDIAHVTFSNAPFVAAYNVVLSAGQWSLVSLVPPPAAGSWALLGNDIVGGNFIGTLNADDVVMKVADVEVLRLLNADQSIRLANNGVVGDILVSAIITTDNDAGGLTLFGGIEQTGAQLTLTGVSAAEPMIAALVANATFFLSDIETPYVIISPTGIKVGESADFGDASPGVVSMIAQTTNPTTISQGGMLYVGSADSNLYYINPSGTFQLTPPSADSWSLLGNIGTDPSVNYMGSGDDTEVSFQVNATEIFRMGTTFPSLQMANQYMLLNIYPSAVINTDSNTGGLLLCGGEELIDFTRDSDDVIPITGAQIYLTGVFNDSLIPNSGFFAGGQFSFTAGFEQPGYVTIISSGIGIGNTYDFGDAESSVLSMSVQIANPTTIAAGAGMIFVGSDENLYYLNSVATYQLTAAGGEFWSLAGNNLTGSATLGSVNSVPWAMICNGIVVGVFATDGSATLGNSVGSTTSIDSGGTVQVAASFATILSQGNTNCAITDTALSYALTSNTTVNLIGTTGTTITDAAIVTIDSSAQLQLGNSIATSIELGNNTCSINLSGASYNLQSDGTLISSGATASEYNDATRLSVDSPLLELGIGAATQIILGNSSSTVTVNSTTFAVNSAGGLTLNETTNDLSINAVLGNIFIDAASQINIAPTNATQLNFGNAGTQSTLVGTQFQISLSTAFVADAPDVQIANSIATIVTFGNASADIVIPCQQIDIDSFIYTSIDSAVEVQVGTGTATTVQVCNSAANFFHNSLNSEFNSVNAFSIQSGTDMQIETTNGNLMIVAAGVTNNLTLASANSEVIINGNMQVVVTSPSITLAGAVIANTVATNTGTVAVPTHTPPAGFNYLCIDASGNIRQFAA